MSIPNEYNSITPYFTVADAEKLIEFSVEVFDGVVIYNNRNTAGRVQHARIRIGDSIIMLNEANKDYKLNVSQMHLYVDDVEAVYSKALLAGAKSLMSPNIRPHGDKMAGLKDPCENIWWIAGAAN